MKANIVLFYCICAIIAFGMITGQIFPDFQIIFEPNSARHTGIISNVYFPMIDVGKPIPTQADTFPRLTDQTGAIIQSTPFGSPDYIDPTMSHQSVSFQVSGDEG